MWKNIYKNIYKTSNPDLFITSVCAFPNIHTTIEKVNEYYDIDKIHNDPLYLNIYSDYCFDAGRKYIPVCFEDKLPKLSKLKASNPIGKGFFWCVVYKNPSYDSKKWTYNTPSHAWYREMLEHWLNNYHVEHSSITKHLFEQSVKTWVYENSKNLNEHEKHRRFKFIENSRLVFLDRMGDQPQLTKEDYLGYLDDMYKTNWYEFVFKSYK